MQKGRGNCGSQESAGLMVSFSSNADTGNRLFPSRALGDAVGLGGTNGGGGGTDNSDANPPGANSSNANSSRAATSDLYFDAPS